MYSFKISTLMVWFIIMLHRCESLNKIVGGKETTIEKHPYQASLQFIFTSGRVSHLCGASIISTKYLLSAAHCKTPLYFLYARMGSTEYAKGGQLLKVATWLNHPQHRRRGMRYDFAVVGFGGAEIVLGPAAAIVPLTKGEDPVDESLVTVTGWGTDDQDKPSLSLSKLHEVNLPVVNQNVCRETYSHLDECHICFGGTPQGMLSACYGDTGGPAVQNGVQYGIVSVGKDCGRPLSPGLYARISIARHWIRENAEIQD